MEKHTVTVYFDFLNYMTMYEKTLLGTGKFAPTRVIVITKEVLPNVSVQSVKIVLLTMGLIIIAWGVIA